MRIVDPKKVIEKLYSNVTLHPAIAKAKEEYEAAVRILELRCSLQNREPTDEEIRYCVNLRMKIDSVCADWIEDKLP